MTQHDNPWKGDGTPPPAEAETRDEAFMRRMAEVAQLDTLTAQLTALNNGNAIAPMDAETCATVVFLANVYADCCKRQGFRTQPDVLRSLLGCAFQFVQPAASEAQRLLGTMRDDELPN